MTRNASQTAMNPISSSGMAQPASTPSIQIRNGFRHRAGATSERAAIAENAKYIALFPGKKAWAPNSTRAAGKTKPIPRRTACDGGNPFYIARLRVSVC